MYYNDDNVLAWKCGILNNIFFFYVQGHLKNIPKIIYVTQWYGTLPGSVKTDVKNDHINMININQKQPIPMWVEVVTKFIKIYQVKSSTKVQKLMYKL